MTKQLKISTGLVLSTEVFPVNQLSPHSFDEKSEESQGFLSISCSTPGFATRSGPTRLCLATWAEANVATCSQGHILYLFQP